MWNFPLRVLFLRVPMFLSSRNLLSIRIVYLAPMNIQKSTIKNVAKTLSNLFTLLSDVAFTVNISVRISVLTKCKCLFPSWYFKSTFSLTRLKNWLQLGPGGGGLWRLHQRARWTGWRASGSGSQRVVHHRYWGEGPQGGGVISKKV